VSSTAKFGIAVIIDTPFAPPYMTILPSDVNTAE